MSRSAALLLVALVMCAVAPHTASAAGLGSGGGTGFNRPTTYEQLASTASELAVTIETTSGLANKDIFLPHECASPAYDAPCNSRKMSADAKDRVRVTARLNGTRALRVAKGLKPVNVTIRLCFSKPFVADRPWRKPSDIIDKDKSCPIVLATVPVSPSGEYVATWTVPKKAVKATYYAQAYVSCANLTAAGAGARGGAEVGSLVNVVSGSGGGGAAPVICAVSSTKGKNFFATKPINSVPMSMKVAAGLCSSIAPAFLIVFFIKEQMKKRV